MDIYTINPTNFLRGEMIETYTSLIWTERYSTDGDFQIVAPATKNIVSILTEDSMVGNNESEEIGIIRTVKIEDGVLTATGPMLTDIFNDRLFLKTPFGDSQSYVYSSFTPMVIMGYFIVGDMCTSISAVLYSGGTDAEYIADPTGHPHWVGIPDFNRQIIEGLQYPSPDLDFDITDPVIPDITVPYGTVMDALLSVSETYEYGWKMVLASVTEDGEYILRFKMWKGLDRTRYQSVNDIVTFSPIDDSLVNISELRSSVGYKSACYAFASHNEAGPYAATAFDWPYNDGIDNFGRRIARIIVDIGDLQELWDIDMSGLQDNPDNDPDISTANQDIYDNATYLTGENVTITASNIGIAKAQLQQAAIDYLANNNYINAVDGEVNALGQYVYGVHYNLGDVVELVSYSGQSQKARITEYIRTQDQSGYKAYPTVSVIQ